ncbi:MAG: hypothetical protein Q7J48_15925 [Nocardioides sp.]|nr:hypothetical protein [Nocardioides sp.]
MNLFALAGVGVVLGAATSGVVMTLVEQRDEDALSAAVLTEDVSARQCATAVPHDAMETLGIVAQPLLTGRNECEVRLGSRDILVSRRPLLTGGKAADLPVAARQSFEVACGLLADDSSSVERSPKWLPRSTRTCARTPAAGQGISEVVVLTAENNLVEIRVLQLDLTNIDTLHEGLAGLVTAAEVVW